MHDASRSTIDRVCSRPRALSKCQFHFCRRQQTDVSRPNNPVDCAAAHLKPIARACEVNLGQPSPATSIFMRSIREQQQINIRKSTRIASCPRSCEAHGADVVTFKGPAGNCAYYGIDFGGLHQFKSGTGQQVLLLSPTDRSRMSAFLNSSRSTPADSISGPAVPRLPSPDRSSAARPPEWSSAPSHDFPASAA